MLWCNEKHDWIEKRINICAVNLKVLNFEPCSGLVNMSAIILSVCKCCSVTYPEVRKSWIQKNRFSMCLDLSLQDLSVIARHMVDWLSSHIWTGKAGCPWASRKCLNLKIDILTRWERTFVIQIFLEFCVELCEYSCHKWSNFHTGLGRLSRRPWSSHASFHELRWPSWPILQQWIRLEMKFHQEYK